jgi:2-polyprenyl-3-methyl-5-hydroxy-6-metoxy-1,4-benzoquinol methylase
MDDSREIDLDQVMEQMRLKIRDNRRNANSVPASASQTGQLQRQNDLAQLHEAYDLSQVSLDPGRKRFGRIMLGAATMVGRLLEPITRHQSQYNAANTRLVTYLNGQIQSLTARVDELAQIGLKQLDQYRFELQMLARRISRTQADELAMHAQTLARASERLNAVEQRVGSTEHTQTEMQARLQSLDAGSQALAQMPAYFEQLKLLHERLLRLERRLRELAGGAAAQQPLPMPSLSQFEMDYAGFEKRLRDSATIREKQRNYLKFFNGKAPVIDAGCGKGEFLELLREAGIEAKGLDLNLDMTLQCRDKGLDVEQRDAIEYLAQQSDDSLGGIFSAQVIEHLTPAQLSAMVTLSWSKLKPGGVVVLETLNPESIFVQYRWFWMDPSHVRLVHPQTLQFMLESAGFTEVACEFLKPPHEGMPIPALHGGANGSLQAFNQATDYLNKLLYGPWEYAMIGRK